MAVNIIKSRSELEKKVNELSKDLQLFDAHLELPNEKNKESIIDFLKDHFYIDETMSKCSGFIFGSDTREIWKKRLEEPLSLILVSSRTGEVMGVCAMNVIHRGLECFLSLPDKDQMDKINIQGYEAMNMFDRYGIDTALRLISLGVHKNYRGQGLGTKLMKAALIYAKDVGLNPVCVCAEATSKISQHIFENYGFKVFYTANYADYKVDGDFAFKNTGDNDSVKFYSKVL